MRKVFLILGLFLSALFILGCSDDKDTAPVSYENGKLTVYDDTDHRVKITANEERYDETKYTAAHRSFSFNSWLVVTNLDNGRRTTVRINDRIAGNADFMIKVSKAAARELGLITATETAEVSLSLTSAP